MDARRRQDGDGLTGWLNERAGDWELSGADEATMQRQKYFWNFLVDHWFRMEFDGWENLPDPPVLLVGIHSGAPFVWDAWTVGVQWWRRFGQDRPLHGTAHDVLMAMPLVGRYFRAMGVLPAAPDSMATALAEGRDVAVWPGGEVDSLRPWSERDRANLAGRKGFVKMAIRAGVPIVPIATVGGADAMPVLIRGDKLSRVLRLDRVLRSNPFVYVYLHLFLDVTYCCRIARDPANHLVPLSVRAHAVRRRRDRPVRGQPRRLARRRARRRGHGRCVPLDRVGAGRLARGRAAHRCHHREPQ